MATKPAEKKLSQEEFVTRAIEKLRRPGYKGIHTVYSGFNKAFRDYFDADPVIATQALAQKGVIAQHGARGGSMIYLAKDAPARKDDKALSTILS